MAIWIALVWRRSHRRDHPVRRRLAPRSRLGCDFRARSIAAWFLGFVVRDRLGHSRTCDTTHSDWARGSHRVSRWSLQRWRGRSVPGWRRRRNGDRADLFVVAVVGLGAWLAPPAERRSR